MNASWWLIAPFLMVLVTFLWAVFWPIRGTAQFEVEYRIMIAAFICIAVSATSMLAYLLVFL